MGVYITENNVKINELNMGMEPQNTNVIGFQYNSTEEDFEDDFENRKVGF